MTEDTVESKLKEKLDSGEITQDEYDEMIKKFENLDLLDSKVKERKRQNYSFTGSKTIDGGEISQPIRVSGKLLSTDSLVCPSLKVSGKFDVNGGLTVLDHSSISGKLTVEKTGKFGGIFKLSGKSEFGGNLYFTDTAKISGKTSILGSLITDSALKVSGKLTAENISSESLIKISGVVRTTEGLEADTFQSSGGASSIGGDLKANLVEIAKNWRVNNYEEPNFEHDEFKNMESLSELGNFVSKMVTEFVPKVINSVVGGMSGVRQPPKQFVIENNLEAGSVDISYTHVKGDIIADEVILGPNVIVDGKIRYRKTITVPEDSSYETEILE